MRILMFGWEFPPHISGGLGTACAGLVQGLAWVGHEVTLLLPRAAHVPAMAQVRFLATEEVSGAALPHLGRRGSPPVPALPDSLYASAYGPGSGTAGLLETGCGQHYSVPACAYAADLFMERVQEYTTAASQLALGREYDVIHCHDWLTVAAGLRAREQSGRPLLLQLHSLESDRNPGCSNPVVRRLEAAGVAAADRIVVVSRYLGRRLQVEYGPCPDKVRVVHNAVRLPIRPKAFSKRSDQGPPQVLFLGRITRQKGPELFLEAAAAVLREYPEVRFVMAGAGDLRPEMMALATTLGIADRVVFPGFLARAAVWRLLAESDIFVLTSHSEPFGIVALEAAANAAALVLCENSGVREVLPEARVVAPPTAAGFAAAILQYLRDPKARAAAVRHQLAAVRACTWERAAAKMSALYVELAETGA